MTETTATRNQLGIEMTELAPGVWGYTVTWEDGTFAIPWIESDTPRAGNVGRYLDGLPKDRRIAFPTVISPVLAGMLLRRGFAYSEQLAWANEYREWVDGFVREPAA